jgi:hypothetical protein
VRVFFFLSKTRRIEGNNAVEGPTSDAETHANAIQHEFIFVFKFQPCWFPWENGIFRGEKKFAVLWVVKGLNGSDFLGNFPRDLELS